MPRQRCSVANEGMGGVGPMEKGAHNVVVENIMFEGATERAQVAQRVVGWVMIRGHVGLSPQ